MTTRPPAYLLAEKDFPMQIEIVRSDTKGFLWGVTLLKPHDDQLADVYIPPCATWVGVPVYVITTNGQGHRRMVGPHA